MRQITGAGEPSSRSNNSRYFFLAAFFFFAFFFAAMVHLLTSGLITYKCIQHLLLHSQIIAHVAACVFTFCFQNAITMFGAPILSYLEKKMQHFCKIV
jgi:hypothetical protein